MTLKKFQEKVAEILPEGTASENFEIWLQDEARIGQRGTVTGSGKMRNSSSGDPTATV